MKQYNHHIRQEYTDILKHLELILLNKAKIDVAKSRFPNKQGGFCKKKCIFVHHTVLLQQLQKLKA